MSACSKAISRSLSRCFVAIKRLMAWGLIISASSANAYVGETIWRDGSGYKSGKVAVANGYAWCYEECTGGCRIVGYQDSDEDGHPFYESSVRSMTMNSYGERSAVYLKGSVTIPSSLNGLTVVEIGQYAFYGQGMTSVTIPSTVKAIGRQAFYYCSLTEVTLPQGLKSIGDHAFEHSGLNAISIPASVEVIDGGAFYDSRLTSVTLHDGLKTIGGYAFVGCNFAFITIPSTVETISYNAFFRCWSLRTVKYEGNSPAEVASDIYEGTPNDLMTVVSPNSMGWVAVGTTGLPTQWNGRRIAYEEQSEGMNWRYAVEDGKAVLRQMSAPLTTQGCVTVPNRLGGVPVAHIETGAFQGYANISSVRIHNGVSRIDGGAFLGCSSLVSIEVDSGNEWFKSVSGMLYDCSGEKLVCCPAGCASVVFTSNITNIGNDAVRDCQKLTSVVIPSSVVAIGDNAFMNCSGLSSLNIPANVASIGEAAFSSCGGLNTVFLPPSVESIGSDAFYKCTGLSRVVISSVEGWCDIEFGNATANPLYYAKHLFLGIDEVTSLAVSPSRSDIGAYAFYNAVALTAVTLPSSVKKIGKDAFAGCTGIRTVEIPASFSLSSAFPSAYSSIVNVTIPSGTTEIAAYAYYGCRNVEKIVIPSGVTSIGAYAFCACRGLTTMSIPASVADIGNSAFANCDEITSVTMPSRFVLSSLFPSAYGQITSLTLLGGEPTVVAGAFAGCNSLTSVEIPADVKTLESNAFKGCANLTSVTFLGEAPACGDDVFAGTSPNLVVHAAPNSSGWMQWNGRPIAFDAGSGGGTGVETDSMQVSLTVTNVMVCYIMNSIKPERVIPASMDAGFVNVITEVRSGGVVSVPATWMVNYPNYVAKFGSDFTKSLMKPTGKYDSAGTPMLVWQDYVAGTDPTDDNDVFVASLTMVDGKPVVSYKPELSGDEKLLRKYTVWGKVRLQDKEWVEVPPGNENAYGFFKVTVEMK